MPRLPPAILPSRLGARKGEGEDTMIPSRHVKSWPVVMLAFPAFVAIWSGWVDLGRLTGFGIVRPLPGIWDEARLNTAITLPIGLETYAAYALYVWLSGIASERARKFAQWSAVGSLILGATGQMAYHLMAAAELTRAPWLITTVVACLPVAVLGMGAALYHLVRAGESTTEPTPQPNPPEIPRPAPQPAEPEIVRPAKPAAPPDSGRRPQGVHERGGRRLRGPDLREDAVTLVLTRGLSNADLAAAYDPPLRPRTAETFGAAARRRAAEPTNGHHPHPPVKIS